MKFWKKLINLILVTAILVSSIVVTNYGGMGTQTMSSVSAAEDEDTSSDSIFDYIVTQAEDSVNLGKLDEFIEIIRNSVDNEESADIDEETVALAEQAEDSSYYPTDPILTTKGNPSAANISLCSKKLAEIPQTLKDRFTADGWTYILTTDKIGDTILHDSNSYQGLTVYNCTIYIENRTAAINGASIHEFGHYVGAVCGEVASYSVSEEWASIYNIEGVNCGSVGMDSYGQTNPIEYFAECFVWYIERPGDLQTYMPQSYEYMSSRINAYFYGG